MPPETSQASDNPYRLPTDVKPTHYDLTIRTDLKDLKFDGYVTIHLDVLQDTKSIEFYVSKLELVQIRLTSAPLTQTFAQNSTSLKLYDDQERVVLELAQTIPAGSRLKLRIDFSGDLTGSMMGYYRSRFEQDGKEAYYALTQFQPTSARRAFPCWDEPAFKATFSLTMVSRTNTVNLANMSAISEHVYSPSQAENPDVAAWLIHKFSSLNMEEAAEWKVTKFDKTPPMSSYIVAWANGPFAYLEASYTSPISGTVRPLRVYTTADAIQQGEFTLSIMKKVMPLYEQMFDIEYPLPKLDTLVATDFDLGAMENWGLITGRTSGFLLDSKKADLHAKQAVAGMQSHEIAHMWFGDITTMAWWDNLYLNEGFATLVGETIMLGEIFPEWNLRAAFVSGELEAAMSLDAKLSSHPIEVDCPDAGMISQIFDALSYDKAASILRMLMYYVTEEKFLRGVTIYLKNHLYANSVTEDLWAGIAEASGRDVPHVMNNWVTKMGFPIVQVTEVEGGIHVRQDRFIENGVADPKDNETIWSIPLSLLTTSADGRTTVDHSILLDEREKIILLDTTKLFKLNAGTVSVYRVLYTPERLSVIGAEATKANSAFSLADRMGLLHDSFALAKAGYLKMSSVLSLYRLFHAEKENLVWKAIADDLPAIPSAWFEYPDIVEKLQAFRRELFSPLVRKLGYDYPEGEHVDVVKLRTTAIQQAAAAGDQSVINELKSRFKKAVDTRDDSYIPADLIAVTYRMAVKYGGRAEFDFMESSVTRPKNPQVQLAAIYAMTATDDLELREKTWEYIMTKSRNQNLSSFFRGLQTNYDARRFLAQKFKENFDTLLDRLAGTFGLKYLVAASFNALTTDKDYEETVEFFKGRDTSFYKLTLEQALDNIKTKSAWIKRCTDDLREWLEQTA
ncbi:hypothetical protein PHLGIDRAFT_32955 [Phlebiopsis gigantea 11061_1 CR5-6]|uniref:Aminopeptidase n=1 Tax=Phlebiopsis gigantea (strain 11061_1 CR5-6) TaxID=745531 RepID=A0A0C3S7E6_PHLG1|nr:hypothetical protein PHLGIDRAFT_32955 [Phlebiopsis gigantea 11061_1 CR5-6]